MKNERSDITVYGKRIKEEARKHGLTNDAMADLLHYSSGKQISPIYSGKQELSSDRFATLSKAWGLRENYLRCIDDWETDEDMQNATHSSTLNEYKKEIEYLQTIGLSLQPSVYWIASTSDLYYGYWDMEKHLTDEAKRIIPTLIDIPPAPNGNPNYYDILDEGNHYSDDDVNFLELKSIPNECDLLPLGELSKNNYIDEDNYDKFSNYLNTLESSIEIMYNAKYKGEELGAFGIDEISTFLKHIDALCKASIETLLQDGIK